MKMNDLVERTMDFALHRPPLQTASQRADSPLVDERFMFAAARAERRSVLGAVAARLLAEGGAQAGNDEELGGELAVGEQRQQGGIAPQ